MLECCVTKKIEQGGKMNSGHLTKLSGKELTNKLLELRKKEREITLEILFYLNEVEARNLHLEEGYGSMFDFCVRKLRYSEGGANRRISTARAVAKYPTILPYLEDGRVNLTSVSIVVPLFEEHDPNAVMAAIAGKKQIDVREYVAHFRPKTSLPREEIRPLTFSRPASVEPSLPFEPTPDAIPTKSFCIHYGGDLFSQESVAEKTDAPEQRFELRFNVSADCHKDLQRVRRLLSGRFPRGVSLERAFEVLVDEYLKRKEPLRKSLFRRKVETTRVRRRAVKHKVESPRLPTRVPSAETRREVLQRDKCCCSYVGPDGVRCESTWDLEIDHRVPFADGGSTQPDNLRLLCRAHNHLAAEKRFGSEFMNQFGCGGGSFQ